MARPLILLDRDGVINYDSDDYIKSVGEWIPIPGSLEAIARLSNAGFRICVASNQSGVARGYLSIRTLHLIHRELRRQVAAAGGRIELISFCPHGPTDGCTCRKPEPGMLIDLGRRLGADLQGTPFVGDSTSDLLAAVAAGVRPYLVLTGKGERTLANLNTSSMSYPGFKVDVFSDLAAFTDAFIQSEGRS